MSERGTSEKTYPTALVGVAIAEARLKTALGMLAERGVTQGRQAALEAAAVVIERCCEEFDRRGDRTAGWLYRAVQEGGSWFRNAAAGSRRRWSPSELLRALDKSEQDEQRRVAA